MWLWGTFGRWGVGGWSNGASIGGALTWHCNTVPGWLHQVYLFVEWAMVSEGFSLSLNSFMFERWAQSQSLCHVSPFELSVQTKNVSLIMNYCGLFNGKALKSLPPHQTLNTVKVNQTKRVNNARYKWQTLMDCFKDDEILLKCYQLWSFLELTSSSVV